LSTDPTSPRQLLTLLITEPHENDEQPSPVQRKGTARALGARHRVEQVLLDYDVDHLPLAPEADITAYLVGLGTAGELVLHREQAHQFDLQEITKITKGAATDARAHTAPLRGGT
jgi:hypothetical protein